MTVILEVNNKQIRARRGDTILQALRENGISVPTLCHIPGLDATGSCRMCVVEVEGREFLLPSCAHPVEENMKIQTHSPRVIRARKTLTELLLANHPDDCLFCPANGQCELQDLSSEMNITDRRFPGKKEGSRLDQSCAGIVRDPGKCIRCGRCVRVCEESVGNATLDFIRRGQHTAIGTCFNKPLNLSSCVVCGQCLMVCPTAALRETDNVQLVMEALHKPELHRIIQVDPGVMLTLMEEFGVKAGKSANGALTAVLHKLGFDAVFDMGTGNDLYIKEITREFSERIEKNENLPLITGNCPAWVKYAEQNLPESFSLFSGLKSPQQLTGNLFKNVYARQKSIDPETVFCISVSTCPARKYEAQREEMLPGAFAEVDTVLTTRELARLIRLNGLDLRMAGQERMDEPFDRRSGSASLMTTAGGTAESILRNYAEFCHDEDAVPQKVSKLRGTKARKEIKIKIGGREIGVVAVSNLHAARQLFSEIQRGRDDIHLIEVMVCPGGCINGGGQPFSAEPDTLQARLKAVHELDEKDPVSIPAKNICITNIYEDLGDTNSKEQVISGLYHEMKKRNVL
jgi:NADH-quinone oxidoreductase subunit G/NADP-reducing hydrogenase subunit HndD